MGNIQFQPCCALREPTEDDTEKPPQFPPCSANRQTSTVLLSARSDASASTVSGISKASSTRRSHNGALALVPRRRRSSTRSLKSPRHYMMKEDHRTMTPRTPRSTPRSHRMSPRMSLKLGASVVRVDIHLQAKKENTETRTLLESSTCPSPRSFASDASPRKDLPEAICQQVVSESAGSDQQSGPDKADDRSDSRDPRLSDEHPGAVFFDLSTEDHELPETSEFTPTHYDMAGEDHEQPPISQYMPTHYDIAAEDSEMPALPAEFHGQLSQVNLERFAEPLALLGVESLSDVTFISDEELESIGMRLVQRRKLRGVAEGATDTDAAEELTCMVPEAEDEEALPKESPETFDHDAGAKAEESVDHVDHDAGEKQEEEVDRDLGDSAEYVGHEEGEQGGPRCCTAVNLKQPTSRPLSSIDDEQVPLKSPRSYARGALVKERQHQIFNRTPPAEADQLVQTDKEVS